MLERLTAKRSLSKAIRVDSETHLTVQEFIDCCASNRIELRYIQPGEPIQNVFIEQFKRSDRIEVLDSSLFERL